MKAIITALESIAPTYPAVAPETERVPYILYSESDTPIVTFDGIAGYDTTLTVTVVAKTKDAAQVLRDKIVNHLHGITFDGATLYYEGSQYVEYPDEKLSSYELTFNSIE